MRASARTKPPIFPDHKHSQVWLAFLERSFSNIGARELGPLILQRRSFNVHRSTAVCGCFQGTELVQPLRFEKPRPARTSDQSPAAKHRVRVRSATGSFHFRDLSRGLSLGKRHVQGVEDWLKHISNDRFGTGLNMSLKNHSWHNGIVDGARANMVLQKSYRSLVIGFGTILAGRSLLSGRR